MEIPFADAVLNLVGRRPAAQDLIGDIERIENLGEEPPATNTALLLQRIENRLVRHHPDHPDVLTTNDLRKLRGDVSGATVT